MCASWSIKEDQNLQVYLLLSDIKFQLSKALFMANLKPVIVFYFFFQIGIQVIFSFKWF